MVTCELWWRCRAFEARGSSCSRTIHNVISSLVHFFSFSCYNNPQTLSHLPPQLLFTDSAPASPSISSAHCHSALAAGPSLFSLVHQVICRKRRKRKILRRKKLRYVSYHLRSWLSQASRLWVSGQSLNYEKVNAMHQKHPLESNRADSNLLFFYLTRNITGMH